MLISLSKFLGCGRFENNCIVVLNCQGLCQFYGSFRSFGINYFDGSAAVTVSSAEL